jgi:hypothetical protein
MNAVRPPSRAEARIVGHVFLEEDGTLSVTPAVRICPDDEARFRVAVLKLGRWRSVNERLLATVAGDAGQ